MTGTPKEWHIEPMAGIPKGWHIARCEHEGLLRSTRERGITEVTFSVVETATGREVTKSRAELRQGEGRWIIAPGSMVGQMEPDEARARAVAFVMAAEEVERRNG